LQPAVHYFRKFFYADNLVGFVRACLRVRYGTHPGCRWQRGRRRRGNAA
jgi:hypothetical protein